MNNTFEVLLMNSDRYNIPSKIKIDWNNKKKRLNMGDVIKLEDGPLIKCIGSSYRNNILIGMLARIIKSDKDYEITSIKWIINN
jgi:hypothetical protein